MEQAWNSEQQKLRKDLLAGKTNKIVLDVWRWKEQYSTTRQWSNKI